MFSTDNAADSNASSDASSESLLGIPLDFFQTTDDFKALLANLQKAQEADLSDDDINAMPKFKTPLASIRLAWKKFNAAEKQRLANEALAIQEQQLAVNVFSEKVQYFALLPEDQERILKLAMDLAYTQGHEFQASAQKFLAKLERHERIQGSQKQEKILANQNRAEQALDNLQDVAFLMKVDALVKRRLAENLSIILAEAEQAFNAPTNSRKVKRRFRKAQVVTIKTREYFADITKARYETFYRKEIEKELLSQTTDEPFISNTPNDETTLLESITPRTQYPPVVSKFAQ
jgi:hypothetical protein